MKHLTQFEWIAVSIAVLVVAYFFVTGGVSLPLAQQLNDNSTYSMNEDTNNAAAVGSTTETNGVVITDSVVGTGAEAQNGKTVSVHYTGKFTDGKVFDSSVPRGEPIEFQLGSGMVISGWEQGLLGMKVGGKRTLTISPDAAYGPNDVQNPQTGEVVIPGNSTLVFDVELVGVK